MSDSVRPSGSEEARAAALAADLKKTKQTQNLAGQQGSKAAGLGQSKNLKSSFDDLLRNASSDQDAANLLPPENKFDSRLKEASSEDERSSDQDKEDDAKPSDKSDAGKKTKEPASGVKERVLAKQSSGEQQGSSSDSSGKREGGSSQKGFQKETGNAQAFASDLKRRDPAPAPVPMDVAKIQQPTITPPEAAEAPREMPKALLDQIVQSVTIINKGDLNKEIQIEFHDRIFNGLKLKVSAQGKEISVEFLVPNRTVEETFKNERENIALALGEKGVDVRSIHVTRM
ncbi:MAG: hypothetical protein K8R69_10310 [Deltaproteobacteria bacterium]|nr:hypothetical protein [Deltaproteobacteria bacterium]